MFEIFAYKLHCPGFAVPIHKYALILKSHGLLLEKSAITMPARTDMAKFLLCLLCLIIHFFKCHNYYLLIRACEGFDALQFVD